MQADGRLTSWALAAPRNPRRVKPGLVPWEQPTTGGRHGARLRTRSVQEQAGVQPVIEGESAGHRLGVSKGVRREVPNCEPPRLQLP